MGVAGMVMSLAMAVRVVMVVDRNTIGLAGPCAFPFAKRAGLLETFDMVVMAFLCQADVLFEAEHLGPVFAQ